ncbi:MAG TPA: SLBB domain-containing protein [Candidatus Eisenbacteria bacterium]
MKTIRPTRIPSMLSATTRAITLALAALMFLHAPQARAQTSSTIDSKIAQTGRTPEEIREEIRARKLSPEQIREALREAGYSPDALNSYMPGTGSAAATGARTPGMTAQPPSGALTTEPMAPSAYPNAPRELSGAELRSDFELEVTKRTGDSTGVRPFGYEIFSYSPTTFEPLAAGPVDPDYPIGPGDEVVVTLWGDNEFTHASIVNREATINVPDIGQVVLNGLTLSQAKRTITDRLGAVYSGIRARRPTTFVDVTLGKLRTVQVFILGDVVRPGGYTISSVSTVLNALYSAGGPTPRGSMRDVRIIRHNEVYRHVDLYGYILTGSKAEDVRLQSGDVVFVPPVGKMVAVLGEVHRPAIYELAPGERFQALLRLSGGVKSTALISRALVDRVVPFADRDALVGQDRVALDLPLREALADSTRDPEMVDRDIVRIFRVGDIRKNTVEIQGNGIYHGGTFAWRPGMRASDLVREAGGLKPDAYLDRALVVRTDENRVRRSLAFHVGRAMDAAGDPVADLELQPLDELTVLSMWDIRDRHTVAISGSVRKPGSYEYLEGMTVMDLVFRAGGLLESASPLEAEVARVDSSSMATRKGAEIFKVPISRDYTYESGAPDTSFVLRKWDQVFVREIPDWQLQRNVAITGEVMYPGTYALRTKDERLSSLLARAGGLKPTAYPRAAKFTRKKDGAGRLAVDVADVALKRGRRHDLVLEDGDEVFIPREPKTVKVVGEVGFPASVLYERGRPLGFYVEQAGGYTESADKGRTKIIQPNGRVRGPRSMWFDPSPEAGALVIVPLRGPQEKKETLKDIATLMTILSGAATTIYLAHQATK